MSNTKNEAHESQTGTVTYRFLKSQCGKPTCRTCRTKGGHGPYWYRYEIVGGQTKRKYIGKTLPPGVSPNTPEQPPLLLQRTHTTDFVGRIQEREALLHLLPDTMVAQQPHGALLVGEAGIGKTRLLEEICREAHQRGWWVAWGQVHAQESGIPYHIWTNALRRAFTTTALKTMARTFLRNHELVAHQLTPLLSKSELLEASSELQNTEQGQSRLWEACYELFAAMSDHAPLLIVLDDLHWSDSSSIELFTYLLRRFSRERVVLLASYRESELSPEHALRSCMHDLSKEHRLETFLLPSLDDASMLQLIATLTTPQPLPTTLQKRILARAAGNAFFAEELARNAIETFQKRVVKSAGEPLPETIAAVLDLRLKRLSSTCQRLLKYASIFGGSFAFEWLQAMETTTDEEDLLDLLDEALQADILVEESGEQEARYSFYHPLLATHLYEQQSAARRVSLHRKAADILGQVEMVHPEQRTLASTITYHLIQCGAEAHRIRYYAEQAANYAYALSDYPEAEQHYRITLDHLSASETSMRGTVLEKLGECCRIRGNSETARHYYELALQHYTHHIEPHQQELLALLWCEVGLTYFDGRNHEQARWCYAQSKQILQDAHIEAGPAWARLLYEQSYLCWSDGNYDEAKDAAQRALALYEAYLDSRVPSDANIGGTTRLQRTLLGDPVDRGRVLSLLAALDLEMGNTQEAVQFIEQALPIFERGALQREIAIATGNLGDLYLKRADYQLAEEAIQRAIAFAEQMGDRSLKTVCLANYGILAFRLTHYHEAESRYRQALHLAQQIEDFFYMRLCYGYLAQALLAQQKWRDAQPLLLTLFRESRSFHDDTCLGLGRLMLGFLRLTQALHTFDVAEKQRFLQRATVALRHVLSQEVETEVRIETYLMMARVFLAQHRWKEAESFAQQGLQEAQQADYRWLLSQALAIIEELSLLRGE